MSRRVKLNKPLKRHLICGTVLTDRECAILYLIATSHCTKEIASELKISPKTVEYHRLNLMHKLNAHDYAALTRIAVYAGLIKLPKDIK